MYNKNNDCNEKQPVEECDAKMKSYLKRNIIEVYFCIAHQRSGKWVRLCKYLPECRIICHVFTIHHRPFNTTQTHAYKIHTNDSKKKSAYQLEVERWSAKKHHCCECTLLFPKWHYHDKSMLLLAHLYNARMQIVQRDNLCVCGFLLIFLCQTSNKLFQVLHRKVKWRTTTTNYDHQSIWKARPMALNFLLANVFQMKWNLLFFSPLSFSKLLSSFSFLKSFISFTRALYLSFSLTILNNSTQREWDKDNESVRQRDIFVPLIENQLSMPLIYLCPIKSKRKWLDWSLNSARKWHIAIRQHRKKNATRSLPQKTDILNVKEQW